MCYRLEPTQYRNSFLNSVRQAYKHVTATPTFPEIREFDGQDLDSQWVHTERLQTQHLCCQFDLHEPGPPIQKPQRHRIDHVIPTGNHVPAHRLPLDLAYSIARRWVCINGSSPDAAMPTQIVGRASAHTQAVSGRMNGADRVTWAFRRRHLAGKAIYNHDHRPWTTPASINAHVIYLVSHSGYGMHTLARQWCGPYVFVCTAPPCTSPLCCRMRVRGFFVYLQQYD